MNTVNTGTGGFDPSRFRSVNQGKVRFCVLIQSIFILIFTPVFFFGGGGGGRGVEDTRTNVSIVMWNPNRQLCTAAVNNNMTHIVTSIHPYLQTHTYTHTHTHTHIYIYIYIYI